mgnify:CR=1 FL=1
MGKSKPEPIKSVTGGNSILREFRNGQILSTPAPAERKPVEITRTVLTEDGPVEEKITTHEILCDGWSHDIYGPTGVKLGTAPTLGRAFQILRGGSKGPPK